MKCLLHSVPAGRWLAFLLPIFTGVTTTLSAQNERDTSLFVDKSDSLTILNRRASSKSDFFDANQNTDAFSRNFDLSACLALIFEFHKTLGLEEVASKRRSANVDFPWSMCAMIQKLRMFFMGAKIH